MLTVNDYLKTITPSQKAEYERIRAIVKAIVPDTEEAISYGVIAFKHKGKYLIYFGGFKDHMSLFGGGMKTIEDKAKGFKISKGTLQFTEDNPVPESLMKEIIQKRLAEIK